MVSFAFLLVKRTVKKRQIRISSIFMLFKVIKIREPVQYIFPAWRNITNSFDAERI